MEGLKPRKYFVTDWTGGPATERPDPLTPTAGALTLTVPALGVVALSTRRLPL